MKVYATIFSRLSVANFCCGNGTLAVAVQISCSLRKFLAISSVLQKIASDAVVVVPAIPKSEVLASFNFQGKWPQRKDKKSSIFSTVHQITFFH